LLSAADLLASGAADGLTSRRRVLVARDLYSMTQAWLFAGVGGAVLSALLNYALSSMFTWGGVCREVGAGRTFAATQV
jgi:hypothetical protein